MKVKTPRNYTATDGTIYPLVEADYDMSFTVYKSDRKRAIIGDPHQCLIALGGLRNRDVQEVYIGSGKDAYVIFKPKNGKPAQAVHFTVPSQAAKVRDAFDTKNAPDTQVVMLRAPTKGRTLAARSASNKARAARIKNGAHVVKSRGTPARKRIMTLGVAHRPTAHITRTGVDTQPLSAA